MSLWQFVSQGLKFLTRPSHAVFFDPTFLVRAFTRKEFDLFQIALDLRPFLRSDLVIKTQDKNKIIVSGRKDTKEGRRQITRTFSKLYSLPKGHNFYNVESHMTEDGQLTITAEIHPTELPAGHKK